MKIYIISTSLCAYVIRLSRQLKMENLSPHICLLRKAQEKSFDQIQKKYLHHGFLELVQAILERIKFYIYKNEIPLSKFMTLEESFSEVEDNSLVVLYNTGLIPISLIQKLKGPALVAHPSYLPFGRGLNGTQQAILEGVPPGVSVLEIDQGIDTGPVWFQDYVNLQKCRDLKKLRKKQAALGIALTVKACKAYQSNSVKKTVHIKRPIKKMTQEEMLMADRKLIELLRK